MAMSSNTVSHTEVTAFRRCQMSWHYRYREGIKRNFRGVRLAKGTILHEMLNAYIAKKINRKHVGPDPWDVLEQYSVEYATYFAAEKEEYGDVIGDCGKIFEGYLRKYRKDTLRYEHSEVDCYFDLPGSQRFAGFIDKIAVDPEGRRWIMDHKFVERIPTESDLFLELQLLLYVWALDKSKPDLKVDGIIWDYCRSKAPRDPEVLKSGELTKRKDIDTDVWTYRDAIRRHKLKEEDYTEVLKNLEGKEDTFFQRIRLPKPSAKMIKEITDDFLETNREIQEKRKPKARCTRSMTPFNCNSCEYRPLCEGAVRGHDVEFILKSEYIQRGAGEVR